MPTVLTPDQLERDLALCDLTDPESGLGAMHLLVDAAVDALQAAWGCEVRIRRGPRVVPLADNYDLLGYPAAAVTREARYTRYVDDHHVLRSHTSAMVPAALAAVSAEPADDVLLVCPGITYRRDSIDRLHTGTPHQLDLWRITRRQLGDAEMDEMVRLLAGSLVPDRAWRSEPRTHPYTVNGRQIDVRHGDEWIEVWECGLAHPDVLARAGLDGWSGLALGMGLDRLVMLRKGVPDIRLLRSTDTRVARQMNDLAPYRAVSPLPALTRDISVAISVDDDAEQVGDRVRTTLHERADVLEEVVILSRTEYPDLPEAARERLGMNESQRNVLLRLVLRPIDHTLTDAEANALRDEIYDAIHQGSAGQWASAPPPALCGTSESEPMLLHMLKSDGTPVTVKLDADFTVTGTESGGGGGHRGA